MIYTEIRQKMPRAAKTETWYQICPERHIHALIPARGNMRVRRWTHMFKGSWGWSVYRYKNCGTEVVHEGYSGGGVCKAEPPAKSLEGVIYP